MVLPPNPRSVGVARWLIGEWCAPWVHTEEVGEDTVESVLLLASEVITNAVVHGAGMVRVSLQRPGTDAVRIEVSDGGGGMPLINTLRQDTESGRGMAMVELLSSRWGTELAVGPRGKVVWFEVPVP